MIFLLLACLPASDLDNPGRAGPAEDQVDGFGDAWSVRITEPYRNQTVNQDFTVRWELGEDVKLVRVLLDGLPVTDFMDRRLQFADLSTSLEGRVELAVVAYDRDENEVSRSDTPIRVSAGGSWVGITTPSDGAHPYNPVVFAAEASEDVDRIEFVADDWSIGSVTPGDNLTYHFAGVGFERRVEALAWDGEELVASDEILVTVEETTIDPGPTDFNEMIIALVDAYPKDGTYQYYWPADGGAWSGSTRDLWYQNQKVASHGGYSACYCSGITWEWYLRAYQEWDKANGGDGQDLNGVTGSEIWSMRTDWYVRELDGPGPSLAMENYGVGVEVLAFEDWRRGDFVQFWRNSGSGHTVVFWDWIRDDADSIIGMEYASCQNRTDGLGINDEYFGSFWGALDPEHMYASRGYLPDLWY